MSDDPTDDELAELKARVDRLERVVFQDDTNHAQTNSTATDHRDAAVLTEIRKRSGEPGPRVLVEMYLNNTDIVNRDTAVSRAKKLRKTDAYTEATE